MRIRLTQGNKRLYLSIFISLTLSILVTMLVVSSILYINFEGIALEQVYSDDMKNLMQTSEGVQIMANTAMTLSNQIYNDLNVAKLLYYSNPELPDIRIAYDQMTNYRLSLSFIDSVYVYNGKAGTVYISAASGGNIARNTIQTEKDFDDEECIGILHNFKRYKQYIPIPRKYIVNIQDGTEKFYYTFLLYDAFSGNSLDSAVIVNISEDWIHRVISDEPGISASETFIINDTGELVSNSSKYPMLQDISDRSYIKEVLRQSRAQGYFIDDVDGAKSLITFTAPDEIGWRYIRITPFHDLFSRIENMKIMTVYIGAGIFILGLLITIFISRKIYIPIDRIQSKLRKLEAEHESNIEIIKHGILKDIILGRGLENKNGLLGKLKSLDIKVDLEGCFRLVLLKIDHYKDFYQKFGAEDRGLYRFAIMNISSELFSKEYKAEAIDMGEGNIVMLINADSEVKSTAEGDFGVMLKSVREAVEHCINVSLTITVSGIENSPEGINILYRQVLEASLHRLFYGHGALIYAEKIEEFNDKEYIYPMQKEKQLVEALLSRKNSEAKRIYDEIVDDAAEYPFSVINLALSHLIFTVNNTVNLIKSNNLQLADFDKTLPAMIVNEAEIIGEINDRFYRMFDSLCEILEERKNMKHEEMISDIHKIINSDFADPSLSIESIAERLDISPTYMCRLYKQYTMATILDKIVDVRMEKARMLLLKTAHSVAEIAEETGFTNSSYFYRAFKKCNGTTPSDFRKAGNNGGELANVEGR